MKQVIFDLETTSAERDKCRIVELAIKCIAEDGSIIVNKSKRYNPGVPITPEATAAHGITNEMVKDYPKFSEDAKKLRKIFEDSTLIGYNLIVFDIPVLLNEFERCGVPLKLSRSVIDVMKVETALSPRTLGAVYERYTGKPLDNAHSANADVDGTEVVLQYQLKKIAKNKLDYDEIMKKAGLAEDAADFFGKLKYDENKNLVFAFGKWKGMAVLLNDDTKQYANWVIGNKEFSGEIKTLLQEELKKATKKQFTHPAPHKPIQGFGGKTKAVTLFEEPVEPEDDLPF